MGTQLPLPQRGTAPPIFGPYLLRLNGCIAQDTTWYGGRPASAQVTVFSGDPATPKKGHTHPHPIFGLCLLWPNGWMDQNTTWYRGKRHLSVIWGRSCPLKEAPPIFCSCLLWPNGWMGETPLGTEVDIGPGHIVLDGVPAPRERGTAAPLFLAHVYCDHGHPSQLLLSSCCICIVCIAVYCIHV